MRLFAKSLVEKEKFDLFYQIFRSELKELFVNVE